MIPTQTQTQFPVFANNGTKLEPDASKYTNGFVEGDVFPYQWENWLMNKASDAITKHNAGLDSIEKELNSILTEAGKTADNTKFNQVLESIVAIITTKISKNIEISDADGSHTGAQVSFNQNGTVTLYLPSEIKATIEGGITSADDSLKFGGETPAQFKATLSGVTTYTSSTTVVPEYDRRYVLNGNGITLTLSSATVTGTRVEVYAQQAANVVHDSTITDALLAGERAIYAWNGTSWDYVGGVPLGQLNYTAHCDTALGTAKALAIPGFTLRNGTTIKVLFDNGYYSSSSGQVMTLNVNALGAKNIYVCKNGSKELLDSHYLLRTEGGISTEQYWFIMSNTMLELMYDATLDSNNGGWLVLGNPVVLSSTDYTIYADGLIEQWQHFNAVTPTVVLAVPFSNTNYIINAELSGSGSVAWSEIYTLNKTTTGFSCGNCVRGFTAKGY